MLCSLVTTHYSLLAQERLGVTQKDGCYVWKLYVSATRFCAFPAIILVISHHVPDSLDSLDSLVPMTTYEYDARLDRVKFLQDPK